MKSALVLLLLTALVPASAWVAAPARSLRPAALTMAAGKDGYQLSRRTFASSLATGAAGVVAAAATAEPALAAASTLDGDYLTSDGVKKCLVVNKVGFGQADYFMATIRTGAGRPSYARIDNEAIPELPTLVNVDVGGGFEKPFGGSMVGTYDNEKGVIKFEKETWTKVQQ